MDKIQEKVKQKLDIAGKRFTWHDLEYETERVIQIIEQLYTPNLDAVFYADLQQAYKHMIDVIYYIRRKKREGRSE